MGQFCRVFFNDMNEITEVCWWDIRDELRGIVAAMLSHLFYNKYNGDIDISSFSPQFFRRKIIFLDETIGTNLSPQ